MSPTRLLPVILLASMLAASGCFPSSFELTAQEVTLSDEAFTLAHEHFIREEGEADVVGRTISYGIDSYAGVWVNDDGAAIAVFATPSVVSMSIEANPVGDMTPHKLLDRVLDVATDPMREHLGLPAGADPEVASEEFARLTTSLGAFNGSRFVLTSGGDETVATIVSGKHGADILVIGVFFDAAIEQTASGDVERALGTLEHETEPPETPTPIPGTPEQDVEAGPPPQTPEGTLMNETPTPDAPVDQTPTPETTAGPAEPVREPTATPVSGGG